MVEINNNYSFQMTGAGAKSSVFGAQKTSDASTFIPIVNDKIDPKTIEEKKEELEKLKDNLELLNNQLKSTEDEATKLSINTQIVDLKWAITAKEREIAVCERVLKAERIQAAALTGKNKDHFNKYYNIHINEKKGILTVTLKKGAKLSQIKKDFKINRDGALIEANPGIKTKPKSFNMMSARTDYDNYPPVVGEEQIVIPLDDCGLIN